VQRFDEIINIFRRGVIGKPKVKALRRRMQKRGPSPVSTSWHIASPRRGRERERERLRLCLRNYMAADLVIEQKEAVATIPLFEVRLGICQKLVQG
jgi:hypothetical protein